MTVRYDRADHFDLTCKVGIIRIQSYILNRWSAGVNSGCVASTPNDGGGISCHNEGRAGDIGIRPIGDAQGDEIAAWLYENREGLGCQSIIYNSRVYYSANGDGWRPYLVNPHLDHVHWELNWSGARAETSWFNDPNAGADAAAKLAAYFAYLEEHEMDGIQAQKLNDLHGFMSASKAADGITPLDVNINKRLKAIEKSLALIVSKLPA